MSLGPSRSTCRSINVPIDQRADHDFSLRLKTASPIPMVIAFKYYVVSPIIMTSPTITSLLPSSRRPRPILSAFTVSE